VEELICRLPHSPTLNSPTILSVFRTMTPRRGMRLAGCEYYTKISTAQTGGNSGDWNAAEAPLPEVNLILVIVYPL
jgi:hypothetical protein